MGDESTAAKQDKPGKLLNEDVFAYIHVFRSKTVLEEGTAPLTEGANR